MDRRVELYLQRQTSAAAQSAQRPLTARHASSAAQGSTVSNVEALLANMFSKQKLREDNPQQPSGANALVQSPYAVVQTPPVRQRPTTRPQTTSARGRSYRAMVASGSGKASAAMPGNKAAYPAPPTSARRAPVAPSSPRDKSVPLFSSTRNKPVKADNFFSNISTARTTTPLPSGRSNNSFLNGKSGSASNSRTSLHVSGSNKTVGPVPPAQTHYAQYAQYTQHHRAVDTDIIDIDNDEDGPDMDVEHGGQWWPIRRTSPYERPSSPSPLTPVQISPPPSTNALDLSMQPHPSAGITVGNGTVSVSTSATSRPSPEFFGSHHPPRPRSPTPTKMLAWGSDSEEDDGSNSRAIEPDNPLHIDGLISRVIEHCQQGNMQKALEAYENLRRLGQTPFEGVYKMLLQVCLDNGHLGHALQLYEEMKKTQVKPTSRIYNLLISACGQYMKSERSYDVFTDMVSIGLPITDATSALVLTVLTRGGHPDLALKVLERLTATKSFLSPSTCRALRNDVAQAKQEFSAAGFEAIRFCLDAMNKQLLHMEEMSCLMADEDDAEDVYALRMQDFDIDLEFGAEVHHTGLSLDDIARNQEEIPARPHRRPFAA